MTEGFKVDFQFHFDSGRTGQRVLRVGQKPLPTTTGGRVPRISRLMALAIRFDDLVRSGEVEDFADIAELGQVTRARVSQIVNLLNLAPEIQEEILFLSPVAGDGEAVSEGRVRQIAGQPDWTQQRKAWSSLRR